MKEALALAIDLHMDRLALGITDAFYARHPEWEQRFGPRGRIRCVEDARFHLRFLRGALRAGSPSAFESYARWTNGVLGARGIGGAHLAFYFELMQAELTTVLGDEAKPAAPFIAAGIAACQAPALAEVAQPDARDSTRNEYLDAVLSGRRADALAVATRAADTGWAHTELYSGLFARSQHRLGELWQANRISVAQEHMASAITQWVAANLYPRLLKARQPIGKALLFGVEGELHQLGVQFMADVLELEGWSVIFLGTNTPTAAALATIDQHRPDVVGVAATMLFSLPATLDAVAEIRGRHPELPVVVGGRAFADAADACREAGVIGVADSLESGRTLVAGVAAARAV